MMVSSPNRLVMTEVRARVDPSLEQTLVAGFQAPLLEARPDGLLRTELLHVEDEWRIQTLWRDREALVAMRASTVEPAAPKLFRSVGADPQVTILEVRASTA
jgi:heme-degrading monooxygenase HmoA